ncbi:MAG: hypothetical protein WC989_05955 [Micavibrio sp.]
MPSLLFSSLFFSLLEAPDAALAPKPPWEAGLIFPNGIVFPEELLPACRKQRPPEQPAFFMRRGDGAAGRRVSARFSDGKDSPDRDGRSAERFSCSSLRFLAVLKAAVPVASGEVLADSLPASAPR